MSSVTSCPKVVYSSWAIAFAVEIWAQIGQIASTAWKNSSGTLPVQLQQWNPCEWQDYDGSQGGQNYHCMVSGMGPEPPWKN